MEESEILLLGVGEFGERGKVKVVGGLDRFVK